MMTNLGFRIASENWGIPFEHWDPRLGGRIMELLPGHYLSSPEEARRLRAYMLGRGAVHVMLGADEMTKGFDQCDIRITLRYGPEKIHVLVPEPDYAIICRSMHTTAAEATRTP